MEPQDVTPIVVSIAAFLVSLTALFFTFRKDAHRVRLEVIQGEYGAIILGVNNDSACDTAVLSVGYFGAQGLVHWLPQVGNYATNTSVKYPIHIDARSLFAIQIIAGRHLPVQNQELGYCVQLATGRFFAVQSGAPLGVAVKMHVASLASRISAGRYVIGQIKRPRLPTRD